MTSITGYNERSWAIDLIAHIQQVAYTNNRAVKSVGGEQSVLADGSYLFPDVLLFGDPANAVILQGWELKFPDTRIDDPDFRENAERKAKALGLDSFLLWNVSYAHLYVRRDGEYLRERIWDDLAHLRTRSSVFANTTRWKTLANDIIAYLNDLFDRGELEGRPFVESYRSEGITSLLMGNTELVAQVLNRASLRDVALRDEIELWWNRYQNEYDDGQDKHRMLARANISNWISKFIFAHVLQGQDSRAQAVTSISASLSPDEALDIFEDISENCDFWTIFAGGVGLSEMPASTWRQFCELNRLLTDLRIHSVDQLQIAQLFESLVDLHTRKITGRYTTPQVLASLLVELTMSNILDDRILDACCGSGTIPRSALERKLKANVKPDVVARSVFAGDSDHQAVQMTGLSMAHPELMNVPVRVFNHDALLLSPDTEVEFRNPADGKTFTERLGQFDAIATNLPFVSPQGKKTYQKVLKDLRTRFQLRSARTDTSAYFPFVFHPILKDGGRLGIIITNAWLGTDWGRTFFELLRQYYNVKSIITSGAGRWFQNSEVSANILILEKRSAPAPPIQSEKIDFILLNHPIAEIAELDELDLLAAQIRTGEVRLADSLTIHSISNHDLEQFQALGLAGNAQFVECDWILDLPLAPLRDFFTIRRGERRGWDTMFYPNVEHDIEDEYIKPVVKSPTEITGYTTTASSSAFSCTRAIEELEELGHTGALQWISHFRNQVNNSGRLLPEVLAKSGVEWYQMPSNRLADMVMPINYGRRLFVARLSPAAFVNQRFTQFTRTNHTIDIDLCHALMNSTIGMFIIEGIGFGRGLSALDLNKDSIERYMHILDPESISEDDKTVIKSLFTSLKGREVLEVMDELEQTDRIKLDQAIIDAYGLKVSRERIYDDLLRLFSIRQSAIDSYE